MTPNGSSKQCVAVAQLLRLVESCYLYYSSYCKRCAWAHGVCLVLGNVYFIKSDSQMLYPYAPNRIFSILASSSYGELNTIESEPFEIITLVKS